jgi:uncharacterized membrane protein
VVEDLVNQGLADPLIVFLIAMLPIFELRGAIPIAILTLDMQWYYASPIAYIGNLVPVPFIFFLIERARQLAARMGIIGVWVEKFLGRTRRRAEFIERYGRVGLMLFVAIPLPITGAWTGIIAAYLIGMRFRDTILPICSGVLLSGIIVTILSVQGERGHLDWEGIVIACAILLALGALWLWLRKRQLDRQTESGQETDSR